MKKEEQFEPLTLRLPLENPFETEENVNKKEKKDRGIIQIDISENSLEELEI